MSYYEELQKGSVVSIGERFPSDSALLITACAEVDRLRADLSAARAEAEEATVRYAELKKQIEVDNWSAEMQRALDFIPGQFVGNDAWENGVKRLADAWAALTAERAELRKDKERLDWVQAQTVSGFLWGFRRFPQTGGGGMYQLIQFVKDESLSESVRSAIDAARTGAPRRA